MRACNCRHARSRGLSHCSIRRSRRSSTAARASIPSAPGTCGYDRCQRNEVPSEGRYHCASHIRPLVVEIGAALLRLEIALDVAERIHDTTQPLPHELIELNRLREREIAPHLHGDLV